MERTKNNMEQLEIVDEQEVAKEIEEIKSASLRDLYRYINGKYYVLLVIAIINAIIAGVTNPARLVFVRDTFNEVDENTQLKDIADGIRDKILLFGILAGIGGVCWYIFCLIFIIIGAKISYELKWRYFKAVLSQDWNWYERQNIEELPTQINVNVTEVENATGKTTGFILYSIGAFLGGLWGSFFSGALLAWCYLIIIPYSLLCGISRGKFLIKGNEEIEKAYERSGADAEQTLSSIRVVKAFGQEHRELEKIYWSSRCSKEKYIQIFCAIIR